MQHVRNELYNDKTQRSTLTLDQCKNLFDIDFIKNLNKMFMCGDFGDAAASSETLKIFEYFRSINSDMELGLNTNGGIQNTTWWYNLGKILNKPKDFCVFSIDGLEDTNHIYRRNVNFSKIIENAQAFIKGGGSAHWDMLVFKHNEHQIDACRNLARELGFSWFRTKISKRFNEVNVDNIKPPSGYTVHTPSQRKAQIKCHAIDDKSLYVTAKGEIFPCCWIGNRAYSVDSELQEILDSPNYQKLTDSWSTEPYYICCDNCSLTDNNQSLFESQWRENTCLR